MELDVEAFWDVTGPKTLAEEVDVAGKATFPDDVAKVSESKETD